MCKSFRAIRSIRGFSLLELMIVLVLMVGILAIAWPNMQRSLRRTTLNEAAQLLREAIDEGRHEAMTTGGPVFVQMKQGNHEVRTGSFANFVNDEDSIDFSNLGLNADDASNGSSTLAQQSESHLVLKAPKKWRLPESVVIAEVNWTSDPNLGTEEVRGSSPDSASNHSNGSSHGASMHHDNASNSQSDGSSSKPSSGNEEMLSMLAGSHNDWWLPFSATGQSRNASIVLYDKSIHEKMTITYASETGALEIVR
jgi:prepilin-type N-terminal cleavage/methylation domain-containing protein